MTRLRIAIIASSRYPIAEPFVGGLEANIWLSCVTLRALGHHVTLFAAANTDARLADRHVPFSTIGAKAVGRRDVSTDQELVAAEDAAYELAMTQLQHGRYDVIHNHSLHPVPLRRSQLLGAPMLTTLHTPPIAELVRAIRETTDGRRQFAAVSAHTARSWHAVGVPASVVPNGVDTQAWSRGPGGSALVWFGRLVPEKGAEFAIDAAQAAGYQIALAGPVIDQAFFDTEIQPRLGPNVRYLGHLAQRELSYAVGRSRAAVVTPTWDEPYGLVVAEALSCGTPVAAFGRGGIPEILTGECGRLAAPGDVAGLASAIDATVTLSRAAARLRAVRHCSVRTMTNSYVDRYRQLIDGAGTRLDPTSVPA